LVEGGGVRLSSWVIILKIAINVAHTDELLACHISCLVVVAFTGCHCHCCSSLSSSAAAALVCGVFCHGGVQHWWWWLNRKGMCYGGNYFYFGEYKCDHTKTGYNTLQPVFDQATSNWTDPKCGQPQPENRPDHGLVQFSPMVFFSPIDQTFKNYSSQQFPPTSIFELIDLSSLGILPTKEANRITDEFNVLSASTFNPVTPIEPKQPIEPKNLTLPEMSNTDATAAQNRKGEKCQSPKDFDRTESKYKAWFRILEAYIRAYNNPLTGGYPFYHINKATAYGSLCISPQSL